MCKYRNLQIGQRTRINADSWCDSCGKYKRFNNTAAVYAGHVTYGNVYDEFVLVHPFVCTCGREVSSHYEMCDTGIEADVSALFEIGRKNEHIRRN